MSKRERALIGTEMCLGQVRYLMHRKKCPVSLPQSGLWLSLAAYHGHWACLQCSASGVFYPFLGPMQSAPLIRELLVFTQLPGLGPLPPQRPDSLTYLLCSLQHTPGVSSEHWSHLQLPLHFWSYCDLSPLGPACYCLALPCVHLRRTVPGM